jgi:hypothetical protein
VRYPWPTPVAFDSPPCYVILLRAMPCHAAPSNSPLKVQQRGLELQGSGHALETTLATYNALVSWARGFQILSTSKSATLHTWQAALWALDSRQLYPPRPTAPSTHYASFSIHDPQLDPSSGTFQIRAPRHPLCAAIASALLWLRAHRLRSSMLTVQQAACAEATREAATATQDASSGLWRDAQLSPAEVLRIILASLLGPEPLMHCCDSALLRLLQFVRSVVLHAL